ILLSRPRRAPLSTSSRGSALIPRGYPDHDVRLRVEPLAAVARAEDDADAMRAGFLRPEHERRLVAGRRARREGRKHHGHVVARDALERRGCPYPSVEGKEHGEVPARNAGPAAHEER